MEYFQLLIFIGLIIFAIVKQALKIKKEEEEEGKASGLDNVDPMPDFRDTPTNRQPLPSQQYSAQALQEKPKPRKTVKKTENNPISPPPEEAPSPTSEEHPFDIHSIEEVRRAVIWSEILNKKY